MKTNKPDKSHLVEGGIDDFEATNEFKTRVAEIRKELTAKYSQILLNERSWVRRLLIKIKLEIAIGKKVRALSSMKNLHAVSCH